MRHTATMLIVVCAVAGPAAAPGTVSEEAAPVQARDQAPATPTAVHAVRGVVKSVSALSLVIVRPGRKPSDLVLVLNPSTLQSGTVAVGAVVAVRYHMEGKTLVALAVTGAVASHMGLTSAGAK